VAIKRQKKKGEKVGGGLCGVGVATAGYGNACQDPREMDFLPGFVGEKSSQGLHNCQRQGKKSPRRGNKTETFTSDLVARSVAHKQTPFGGLN